MAVIEDVEIYPRMLAISGALEAELKRRGLPLSRVMLLPEGPATLDFFDEECEGVAWVRLASGFPYVNWPNPDENGANCNSFLGFELEIGYGHCAPMPRDDGTPPSVQEQIEATRVQTSAMAGMRNAIRAALDDDDDDLTYVLGRYVAALQGGGMLGATWTVTLGDRRA